MRAGVVYALVAWLLAQVADLVSDNFDAPKWVIQSFLYLLVAGFPVALIIAWAFELTPQGLRRELPDSTDSETKDQAVAASSTPLTYAVNKTGILSNAVDGVSGRFRVSREEGEAPTRQSRSS